MRRSQKAVGEKGCALIEMVAMNMWQAYIGSVTQGDPTP